MDGIAGTNGPTGTAETVLTEHEAARLTMAAKAARRTEPLPAGHLALTAGTIPRAGAPRATTSKPAPARPNVCTSRRRILPMGKSGYTGWIQYSISEDTVGRDEPAS